MLALAEAIFFILSCMRFFCDGSVDLMIRPNLISDFLLSNLSYTNRIKFLKRSGKASNTGASRGRLRLLY